MSKFKPIFVVGHPRSGTTMLASLLGRHSKISMPPETMFFFDVYEEGLNERIDFIEKAMNSKRVSDLGLERELLVNEFYKLDNSMRGLFQSILISYCNKSGKVRPGEKTPLHLKWASTIVKWFPDAKIICIIRDGRDVVNSLLNVPWSHDNTYKHCYDWGENILLARKLENILPDQFMTIKYEDILAECEVKVKEVCHFVGEEFQPEMLINSKSGVVPEWEKKWKGKAVGTVDRNNTGKWVGLPLEVKETMNTLMINSLKKMGYPVRSPNLFVYVKCWMKAWPFHPKVRPFFSALKRSLLVLQRKK